MIRSSNYYDPRDKALNDALSGEADAVRRAESAELGCEIAYRRETAGRTTCARRLRDVSDIGRSDAAINRSMEKS